MSIVRKITAKTVCGKIDKKAVINSTGESLWLMAVYGRTHRALEGETDYGKYLKFKGSFEAVNLKNGEAFKSLNLILPPIAEELLEEGLNGEGVSSLDFALNVGVRRDDDSISGYQWVAESIRASDSGDPLEKLRAELEESKLIPFFGGDETEGASEPATTSAPPKKKAAARK